MSMQFKVPQNIDMQDRIFGPLTLFQFLYLLFGGLFFYTILKNNNLLATIFLGIPILLLALALAFVKIQEQPFAKFVLNFLRYLIAPKTKIWHKGPINSQLVIDKSAKKSTDKVAHKTLDKNRVKQLAQNLDNPIK